MVNLAVRTKQYTKKTNAKIHSESRDNARDDSNH